MLVAALWFKTLRQVYQSKQEVEIFDEIDQQLPMPEFAQDLQLTIGELFGWLIE
jgi:Uma2 family endonuclease